MVLIKRHRQVAMWNMHLFHCGTLSSAAWCWSWLACIIYWLFLRQIASKNGRNILKHFCVVQFLQKNLLVVKLIFLPFLTCSMLSKQATGLLRERWFGGYFFMQTYLGLHEQSILECMPYIKVMNVQCIQDRVMSTHFLPHIGCSYAQLYHGNGGEKKKKNIQHGLPDTLLVFPLLLY